MNIDELRQITWLEPWFPTPLDSGRAAEIELQREITTEHSLYGLKAVAVARRADCDDYLFFLSGNSSPLAVVHLTYRAENTRQFPHTVFYSSLDEWIEKDMKVNHLLYVA